MYIRKNKALLPKKRSKKAFYKKIYWMRIKKITCQKYKLSYNTTITTNLLSDHKFSQYKY